MTDHMLPTEALATVRWTKSSYSAPNNECVECAAPLHGWTAVRDSKDPDRGVISFSDDTFAAFLTYLKAGR